MSLKRRMISTCSVSVPHTSRLHEDADEVEQNDWAAWPDHSVKRRVDMIRNHIAGVINLLIVFDIVRLSDR